MLNDRRLSCCMALLLRPIAAAVSLVVLAACSSATEPPNDQTAPPPGVFTTDAVSYLAMPMSPSTLERYSLRVITHYTNPTSATIYLETCFPGNTSPVYGVQLTSPADTLGAAYDPVWACVGHDKQIAVAPGATRVDSLTLMGPNAFDGVTHKGFGVLNGRFRLVFGPQSCTGDGQCPRTADALRYSNEFAVQTGR